MIGTLTVNFGSLGNEAFLKWDLLLKERICSKMSKFFSFRVDSPLRREANKKRLTAYTETVAIHHILGLLRRHFMMISINPSHANRVNCCFYGLGHFESLSGMLDTKYTHKVEVVLRWRESAFLQSKFYPRHWYCRYLNTKNTSKTYDFFQYQHFQEHPYLVDP